VLLRRLGDTWAVTATNNASAPRSVALNLPAETAGKHFVDALTGHAASARDGVLTLQIPALFGTVLIGS